MGMEEVLEEIRLTDGWAPTVQTVWNWEDTHPEFFEQSARARTRQARLLHDRAQKYAREALIGRIETTEVKPDGTEVRTVKIADNVERSKLLVQTTLKRAGQLDCKKYGDKVQTEVSGPNGGAIQHEIRGMKAARAALYGDETPE
jgi:hypothetical protein